MNGFELLAREIFSSFCNILDVHGIFYRAFYRVKNLESMLKKIETKNYLENGKKLQDFLGIRIVLYFKDDVEFLTNILTSHEEYNNSQIDTPMASEFTAQRLNFVFNLSKNNSNDFDSLISSLSSVINRQRKSMFDMSQLNAVIDRTYEIQIRTVFSEGWHEVEHDLKYKCSDEWRDYGDLSRVLNGIYATLDTSDWAIINLFKELSYRNYKNKEWAPMLRNKLRLRFQDFYLKGEVSDYIDSNPSFSKELYRVDRHLFMKKIGLMPHLPLTLTNTVFVINYFFIEDKFIRELTPNPLLQMLSTVNS